MSMNIRFNTSNFENKYSDVNAFVPQEVAGLLNIAAGMGLNSSKQALNAAVTPYGKYRMSKGRGNTAGRNDTGNMIDAMTVESATNRNLRSSFGWSKKSENYFYYQERGTVSIHGAFSLLDGRKFVLNQLPRLVSAMKSRINSRFGR